MPQPPAQPKIYHILHVDKLASVIADGSLLCDSAMVERVGAGTGIGMRAIKERRRSLPVSCHPGDCVGDYVPFYFCPRSIMLYVIHCRNHLDLAYRDGQGPIVHLEADLRRVVAWADAHHRRWAFSLANAGAAYTQFRSSLDDLQDIDWPAVGSTDFRSPEVKEGKQAEFLVHQAFPWHLVDRIGVTSLEVAQLASNAMHANSHRPTVELLQSWYY